MMVRGLTGQDERRVRDTTTLAAIDLLERLVEWPAGLEARADELTASDRDRLLAAVYKYNYGRKVNSTSLCTACSSPYDLSFSLDDLTTLLDGGEDPTAPRALPDGTFLTAAGLHFRLPVARDELEVAVLPPEQAASALAARCLLEPSAVDPHSVAWLAELEAAIEEVAPVFDIDINTACPECGTSQVVRFDVQFYLLRTITQDHMQMAKDIHRLASAYRWSLEEILSLERTERKMLVQLIEADMASRRRAQ